MSVALIGSTLARSLTLTATTINPAAATAISMVLLAGAIAQQIKKSNGVEELNIGKNGFSMRFYHS